MVSNKGLRILCYFYIRFDKVRKKGDILLHNRRLITCGIIWYI